MKKQILRLIPFLLILIAAGGFQPGQAAAQGDDIETVLARAAIKGYLTSLAQNPRSPTLVNFYLATGVAGNPVAQSLGRGAVEAFEIVEEAWVSPNLYRARATISPGNRLLIVEASRVKARWQIVNLVWNDSPPAGQMAPATPLAAAGSGPAAEILTDRLNVRAGPGLGYPVQATLNQGDQVEIVGVNLSKDWYQVARAGEVIGWISAQPDYVAVSATDVPVAIVSVAPPGGEPPVVLASPPAEPAPVAKTDLDAFPQPDFLPVTGLGRTLSLPLALLAVAALLVKGLRSMKQGRGR